MALIKCPECNKEISDTTKSCPHCGYSIKKEITQTELGDVEIKTAVGVMYILLGIISVIIGLFTVGIIIGIFILIGGVAFLGMGAANISGMQNGVCPYCNNYLKVRYKDTTVKCSHCKNISRKTEIYLEKIN